MQVIQSPKKLSKTLERLREKGKRIGFVPTMGFLHEGHLSLVRRARLENDCVAVSIFVNPAQFGPKEDFKRYPRNLKQDQKLLLKERVDFLFVPTVKEIYPPHLSPFPQGEGMGEGVVQYINPGPLARYLCGPKRPGHFRGVATVVNRLFQIVRPHIAYFGAKDFQQARIIQEMVRRLKLPIRIQICPIVRDRDGVALSSRNRYLSRKERIFARSLHESLCLARKLIRRGETNAAKIKEKMKQVLLYRVTKIDYVEVADPVRLVPLRRVGKEGLVAVACFVGKTRLIDNLLIKR